MERRQRLKKYPKEKQERKHEEKNTKKSIRLITIIMTFTIMDALQDDKTIIIDLEQMLPVAIRHAKTFSFSHNTITPSQ